VLTDKWLAFQGGRIDFSHPHPWRQFKAEQGDLTLIG